MKEKYQQIILVRVVPKLLHDEPHSSESLLYSVSSPSVFSTWCHPSEHQIAYKNPAKKTLKAPWQLCGACLPLAPLSETLLLTPLILHLLQRFPQPFGSWLKARSLPLSPAFSRKPLTRILQIRECANSGSYCFHLLEPVIAGAFLISKTLECEKRLFLASVFFMSTACQAHVFLVMAFHITALS